jgi:hypothetical protein
MLSTGLGQAVGGIGQGGSYFYFPRSPTFIYYAKPSTVGQAVGGIGQGVGQGVGAVGSGVGGAGAFILSSENRTLHLTSSFILTERD